MCLLRFKSYGEHSDAELLRTYGFVTLAKAAISFGCHGPSAVAFLDGDDGEIWGVLFWLIETLQKDKGHHVTMFDVPSLVWRLGSLDERCGLAIKRHADPVGAR